MEEKIVGSIRVKGHKLGLTSAKNLTIELIVTDIYLYIY